MFVVEELFKLLQAAKIPLWHVQPLTQFRVTDFLAISSKTRRQATTTSEASPKCTETKTNKKAVSSYTHLNTYPVFIHRIINEIT